MRKTSYSSKTFQLLIIGKLAILPDTHLPDFPTAEVACRLSSTYVAQTIVSLNVGFRPVNPKTPRRIVDHILYNNDSACHCEYVRSFW